MLNMISIKRHKIRIFTLLLAASFAVLSALPSLNHAPRVLDTLQTHIEMTAEHGHSHGFAEDLLWAMHGHDHDEMDHDHSPVMLSSAIHDFSISNLIVWQQTPLELVSSVNFLIERPPKV